MSEGTREWLNPNTSRILVARVTRSEGEGNSRTDGEACNKGYAVRAE